MNAKELVGMVVVAAMVAGATVAGFYPTKLDAVEAVVKPGEVAKPKLKLDGLELTMTLAGDGKVAAGQTPVMTLEAVNPTDEPINTQITVFSTQTLLQDMMSRMPRMPKVSWQQTQSLHVPAGGRIQVNVESGVAMPAGAVADFYLRRPLPAASVTPAAQVQVDVAQAVPNGAAATQPAAKALGNLRTPSPLLQGKDLVRALSVSTPAPVVTKTTTTAPAAAKAALK